MWFFGSRIDEHDDPTPNREVMKEELEGNADVQSTVVVRDDQLLRRRLCRFFLFKRETFKNAKMLHKKKGIFEYFVFTSKVIGEDFKVVIRDD